MMLILFLLLVCTSCGTVIDHSPQNQKYLKIAPVFCDSKLKEDVKHGEWCEYYDSGEIKKQGFYNRGKADKSWTEYYKSGEIKTQLFFENGILKKEKHYHKNGILAEEITYIGEGMLFIIYDEQGQVINSD
jgi:antitoxin component YwqK of YwqJK toxin-antitoxin module